MAGLGVNIDHVATLREVRHSKEPDPVAAALECVRAGADSIVAHLREDRRHIKDKDVFALKDKVKVKFNLEMSLDHDIIAIACKVRPDQATFVPERRKELTTEGGLDVVSAMSRVKDAITLLTRKGIDVSLFIDPDSKQIDAAKAAGAKMIEIHTGRYADARGIKNQNTYYKQIADAAAYACGRGLRVCAGHGLDYRNVTAIARIPEIEELNIGYSIICRSIAVGLESAVKEMKDCL